MIILETPLDCKEIKPVSPKGNQSWIFIGRTEAEAEAPVLWLPDAKSWLTGKDPDAGKDKGRRRKRWQRMRWLDGITDNVHEFEQTLGDFGGQRSHGATKSQTRLSNSTTMNNDDPYWLSKMKISGSPKRLKIKTVPQFKHSFHPPINPESKVTYYCLGRWN